MSGWNAAMKNLIMQAKIIRLKEKVYQQAEQITRLERSRAGLKKENYELRETNGREPARDR